MTGNFNLKHSSYRCEYFTDRFFKHSQLTKYVNLLAEKDSFNIDCVGQSVKGKNIYRVKAGNGNIPILLWSQMHGDESTGTMALFDLLNFLHADDDYNELRKQILENCSLHLIPMLNPDGADVHQRRNAMAIDINRDFLALQSPEARILMKMQQEIQPQFGFNLHDQDSLWSVSGSKLPATISLLAPPVDALNTQPPCRLKAIQMISGISRKLKAQIPGQIGRWQDEYEPRAVGETFQRMGVSTMLIEAGSYRNDQDKQFVRKLNFEALVYALEQISSASYINEDIQEYFNIPLNAKEIFHVLIKNCRFKLFDEIFTADIGLNHTELVDGAGLKIYTVADLGDLSTWNGYEILEADENFVMDTLAIDKIANFTIRLKSRSILRFVDGILKNE